MADKKLESITFPDLPDRYVVKPDIADVTGLQTALDGKADKEDVYNGFVSENIQGSIASFDDGADDIPVKSLVADIVPVQSGSGDPSPDNVRPITGWTEAKIHVADGESPHIVDNVTTINWQSEAGTVYGGSIDVTTGVLTVDGVIVDLGTLDWSYASGSQFFYTKLGETQTGYNYDGLCSHYQKNTGVEPADKKWQNNSWVGNGYNLIIKDTTYTSDIAFKAAMSGVQLYYPLETPQTYQLTPTEVKTLLGNNNVWADTGDIDLTYRADLGLYLDKIINA